MVLWAIVDSRGKIVTDETSTTGPLLIFKTREGAEYAKWKPGEKVERLDIRFAN